ncbi:uncharacterized protein At2g39795, mitochondrial [Cyclospora cayetanensis]|uniref:Uncharacterized protein At2g39795, mitochondrial n=1 Tax=Cyclospora cayetanensis TaxID=88456 RepID=A0A6P6RZ48_9EIME|nr:uncharacterized protein At2g39795, mitochondrial [Cyclospora cayetanensis]
MHVYTRILDLPLTPQEGRSLPLRADAADLQLHRTDKKRAAAARRKLAATADAATPHAECLLPKYSVRAGTDTDESEDGTAFCSQQRHMLQQQRAFSSSTAAAESLAGVIQKEIAHEKSQYEADSQLKSFLESNKWQLEDKENDVLVTLTKEVDGRKVIVEFSCIQPSGGDEEETIPEASDFTVSVQNPQGSGLLFYCSTTNEDEAARFCIGQVRYFSDASSKDSLAEYPGPYFEDLDDSFQQGLDSWLSALGIDGELCDFIDRFAADKENREYIAWLNKLQGFISKA